MPDLRTILFQFKHFQLWFKLQLIMLALSHHETDVSDYSLLTDISGVVL